MARPSPPQDKPFRHPFKAEKLYPAAGESDTGYMRAQSLSDERPLPLTIKKLKEFPLFAAIEEECLAALAAVMELRRVRRGACILKADDPGRFIMFILSGKLKVERVARSGREFVLDILGPGDFFGELALLTGKPRSANVEAAEDSVLLILSQHDFEQHALNNAAFMLALLRELAQRCRQTSLRASDVALYDVSQRLCHVLLSLSEERQCEGRTVRVVEKRPTHRELAALAGTTREVVTKALKELEAAGEIEVDGKKVTFLRQR